MYFRKAGKGYRMSGIFSFLVQSLQKFSSAKTPQHQGCVSSSTKYILLNCFFKINSLVYSLRRKGNLVKSASVSCSFNQAQIMDFLFSSHLKDTLAMTCSGLLRRVKQSKVKRGHIRHTTEEIIKCKGTCQYLPPACFIDIVWVYFR